MIKDNTIFLKHIIECIEQIEAYTSNVTEEIFLESKEKQDAVVRRLEIIGEAVKNLAEDFKKEYPYIPWNKAMATRNIIVHEYFGIDYSLIWSTIKQDLPELKKQVKELVEELDKNL